MFASWCLKRLTFSRASESEVISPAITEMVQAQPPAVKLTAALLFTSPH
jgi:hypothetical protein